MRIFKKNISIFTWPGWSEPISRPILLNIAFCLKSTDKISKKTLTH